jgi:hypothetical protein
MEEVGAVSMDFDAGVRVRLGVGVAPSVRPTFDDNAAEAKHGAAALGYDGPGEA